MVADVFKRHVAYKKTEREIAWFGTLQQPLHLTGGELNSRFTSLLSMVSSPSAA